MSGTAARKRTRLSPQERRERLLAAAAAEFAERGYEQGSLRSIASSANVTTPVIYDHFESKAELYSAVAWQQADLLLARWSDAPQGSPHEVLSAVVDRIFEWIEEHPHGWRILFADTPNDPVVAETLAGVHERAGGAVAQVFASAPALDHPEGISRKDANAALGEAAKNAINGLGAWWWHNRHVPRQAVVELAVDLLWGGLNGITGRGPEKEAPR